MKILLHGVSLQVIIQGSFRHRMTVEMNKEHSNFQRDVSTNLVVVSWTVLKVNGNKWAPRVVGHGHNLFKRVLKRSCLSKVFPLRVCLHSSLFGIFSVLSSCDINCNISIMVLSLPLMIVSLLEMLATFNSHTKGMTALRQNQNEEETPLIH